MTQISYSFQRNHLVVQQICLPLNFFVQACSPGFSAHSDLLYNDNKYVNGTTICTCLKFGIFLLFHKIFPPVSVFDWMKNPLLNSNQIRFFNYVGPIVIVDLDMMIILLLINQHVSLFYMQLFPTVFNVLPASKMYLYAMIW